MPSFSSPEPPVPLSRRGLRTRERRPLGPRAQPPAAKRTRRLRGFRAEKRKKHARTLRERWAPEVSKMAAILIFLFSKFTMLPQISW